MDKAYIKSLIQNILNKEFPNSEARRKINSYEDRFNVACPYCRDSATKDHMKRGNCYLNRLFYICFNCDKKVSFDRFLKDFNQDIDPDKKLEMIEYLNSNITYSDYTADFVDTKLDNLFELSQLEDLFNIKKTAPIYDFKPIQEGGGIYKYLLERGIPKELHRDIYQAKFSKGEDNMYEHVIVFLNRKGSKVLGIQIRNLRQGKKRFFLIYNWESLYKFIHGDDTDIDLNTSIVYNKLSCFFNILNVDFAQKITVFEGFLDSIFYKNSIGLCGVNSDLRFLENNNLELQYFFDNDSTGIKKSEQKLKAGYPVFLWNKLFESIVKNKKTGDPYEVLHRISKIKDLNKLCELVPNAYGKLHLPDFFSQDIYDLIYLPKEVKKKVTEKDYSQKFKLNEF